MADVKYVVDFTGERNARMRSGTPEKAAKNFANYMRKHYGVSSAVARGSSATIEVIPPGAGIPWDESWSAKQVRTEAEMFGGRIVETTRPNPYDKENGLGDLVLMGLGLVTLVGIGWIGYKFYESEQEYVATLPVGTPVTSAGYSAWLQTPAGQATEYA